MDFAKSKLDFFYANGGGLQTPNLIALKDIMSTGANPTAIFPKGTLFYAPISFGGSNQIKVMGSEPIVLGENARGLTSEEVATFKAKDLLKVGTDVAQELGDKALNEEGLVRKSNIAWWLLGGLVVYLIVIKK
jgi:hypothetical protein